MTDQQLTPGRWRIDPVHSELGFSVRHMMISRVRGRFEEFDAVLDVAEDPLRSSVRATIDASSIDTDNKERDDHIRSADFFDVGTYPTWTFVATGARPSGDHYLVTGDLTIKGRTRPVQLRVEFNGCARDSAGRERAGFHAETELSRGAYGVDIEMPMDGGGVVVGDRIRVEIDAEFTRDRG